MALYFTFPVNVASLVESPFFTVCLSCVLDGHKMYFLADGKQVAWPSVHCSLFGDDHIKTFDESLYDFAGDCSYLLAGDCHKRSFSLLGEFKLDLFSLVLSCLLLR